MFRNIIFLTVFTTCFSQIQAQNLYQPRNIQQAYKNGTRSEDGKPGKNYWQNFGRYQISVTALPPDRTVRGSEEITYVNNSPNELNKLLFKLIGNIHKPGVPREGTGYPDYLNSGVEIDSLSVNGKFVDHPEKLSGISTNMTVNLSKPLTAHDSVKLHVAWHYPISIQSGREGMLDKTTYYLAYFYPRVAVYDDYYGWDILPFTDGREFYNDFNDYTLNVKVPDNYIVWATGTLLNPKDVLQPTYEKKFEQSLTTDAILNIATKEDLAKKQITKHNKFNVWKWKASNISDMTVNISDHYNWDASSVIVDEATKRRASVQAAYQDSSADFHHMVGYGRHALDWFSHNWPGVPYPFEKTTIVQGFAGMEYPMMVNDESYQDTTFSRFVAEHEIAHTWFPFYMGINESRYAFMDEGWATTLELLIGTNDMGKDNAEKLYKQFRVERWINDKSGEEDLPIITMGNMLSGSGLGNNEYGKPSLAYLALKDMLGDAEFKKCLHVFMDRWHGKHPIPWDFFNSMSNASGKNLNWYWNNWFFSNNYIDLSIQKAIKTAKGYNLMIDNIGGFAVPFDIIVTYADGSKQTIHQTPEVWQKNQKQTSVLLLSTKKVASINIDGGIWMDADKSNNNLMIK